MRCERADDLAVVWVTGVIWVAAGVSPSQSDAGGRGLGQETEEGRGAKG
jgi:hypothetical protein